MLPKTIETKDRAIAPSIKYCAFIATAVLINATDVKAKTANVPESLKLFIDVSKPRNALKLSANPINYKEMDNAVPTKSVKPMAPPMGNPKLRERT